MINWTSQKYIDMITENIALSFEKECKDFFFKRYRIKHHTTAFCQTLDQKNHTDYVIIQRAFFFKSKGYNNSMTEGLNSEIKAIRWGLIPIQYDKYILQHISAFALQYSIKMIKFVGDLNYGIKDITYSYNDKLDIWQKN